MKAQAAQSQYESLIINMCVSFCIILKMAVIIKDLYVGIQVIDLRWYFQEFSIKMLNCIYLVPACFLQATAKKQTQLPWRSA